AGTGQAPHDGTEKQPIPPSLGEDESIYIEEGKDVTLTCNAKSNPQGQTTWYKNNTILALQSHYQVYQTSETFQLSIKKVQKSDNGTYTCEVKSTCGDSTKDFHLIGVPALGKSLSSVLNISEVICGRPSRKPNCNCSSMKLFQDCLQPTDLGAVCFFPEGKLRKPSTCLCQAPLYNFCFTFPVSPALELC
uniref:Ig-like domain-containing protein n=1 Tax=Coturnix japonica TaxID=93934 RepID=A0A8C2TMJ2_COTJA